MTIIVRYDHPKHAAKIQMQTADRPTLSLESRQELPEHAVVLETSYEVAGTWRAEGEGVGGLACFGIGIATEILASKSRHQPASIFSNPPLRH